MASQGCKFAHGWELPDNDSIFRVAMGADKLVYVFAKHKVTYLRVSLNALRLMTVNCVPESDASVSRATTTGKKSLLVG